jgi:AcrR family transcriptional regulator
MPRTKAAKRGQGRPAENVVGRNAVLETAKRLIKELPPARVTISLVARETGVDPALVRYYFGDRSNLLLAVAESMMSDSPRPAPGSVEPLKAIELSISQTARFTSSTKHIHRLMVDELADAKSGEVGRQLGELNRGAVEALRQLMQRDGGASVREVDPTFLHLALVGLFDFFVSAEPVVRQMVPKDTDMKALSAAYEAFVTDLVLNGLRTRD